MTLTSTVFLDVVGLRHRFDAAGGDALVSPAEVAAATGYTPGTLTVYRATGKGPRFVKLGSHRVMYRKADVLEWLKCNVRQGKLI